MAKFKIIQQFECDKCQRVMCTHIQEEKSEFDIIECFNQECGNYAVEFKLPKQYIEAEINNG